MNINHPPGCGLGGRYYFVPNNRFVRNPREGNKNDPSKVRRKNASDLAQSTSMERYF